jgi:hypothetical protein
MDERLSLYLVDIIQNYEQMNNITELKRTEIMGEVKVHVEYVYDLYSRFDRKWHLKGKSGRISLTDSDLKSYYRDIKIDQLFE